ncbi:glycosyltransferase family 39 protein [Paenibacillus roseipurpureus]|uniref:Glycosyltransferase family 39 protein n=1 Tax=Paenibacillus roseopurpureus TaxID=2918901 RepID=A0AA96LSM6_9BACL|nr:glycosyltransferase family 39 protein [Paenibacillus sp. MBLB1832]WNR43990.1 glycosyltransferase family 39 protein [Paenibacillus sp. MBLB1832]
MSKAFAVLKNLSDKVMITFVLAIFFFTLLGFLVTITTYMKSYSNIVSWLEWIWVLPAILLFYLCIQLGKFFQRKSELHLVIFAVTAATICYLILNLSYNTLPVSDYKDIWTGANEMAAGTFTGGHDPSNYFYYYNWQVGIAAFESIIIRIFGSHFWVLKILNIIILNLISWGIYRIAKKKTGREAACITYMITIFYLPYLLSVPQFSNQHLTLLLLLVAFHWIEKNKFAFSALTGLLLAVLNILRPVAIVVVLTILCYWLYVFFRDRAFKKWILHSALLALTFFIAVSGFDKLFVKIDYADAPVSQPKMPYFKYVKGLGGDQGFDKLAKLSYDYETFNQIQKEQLNSLITEQPVSTVIFVINKMCRYWGLFDYQFEHTFNHDPDYYYQYPVKALYMISWFQYMLCILLALIGFRLWKQKHDMDVYVIFFIGYNLVYLLIEAFSSYRFIVYPFIIIMSGYAIHELRLYEINRIVSIVKMKSKKPFARTRSL